jgi:hypothetical protein
MVVDLRFLPERALTTTVVVPFGVGEVGDGGAGLLALDERVVVVGDAGSGKGFG